MLAHRAYYQANKLGEGSFGAVVLVYNDDADEYAAKVFRPDPEEHEDEDEDEVDSGVDVGALRELSVLRLLNGAHPNVMRVVDVSELDGELCMIMPKAAGDLSAAIEGKGLTGAAKLRVAGLLLDAIGWLAGQSVMHRDIKPDNILMMEGGEPMLTDFSLAKVIDAEAPREAPAKAKKRRARGKGGDEGGALKHTAGMGTPTYTAPEIVNGAEVYGTQADVWSLGVVMYEMFNGELLAFEKDKHALPFIEELRAKLSDKPVPKLLKAMLTFDPADRPTARAALAALPGADKLDLPKAGPTLDLAALAAALDDVPAAHMADRTNKGPRAPKAEPPALAPRKVCELMECANPKAAAAAELFWRRSASARERGPAGAATCAMLAIKSYEVELRTADELCGLHRTLAEYDPAEYALDERAILKELDYCLLI